MGYRAVDGRVNHSHSLAQPFTHSHIHSTRLKAANSHTLAATQLHSVAEISPKFCPPPSARARIPAGAAGRRGWDSAGTPRFRLDSCLSCAFSPWCSTSVSYSIYCIPHRITWYRITLHQMNCARGGWWWVVWGLRWRLAYW